MTSKSAMMASAASLPILFEDHWASERNTAVYLWEAIKMMVGLSLSDARTVRASAAEAAPLYPLVEIERGQAA